MRRRTFLGGCGVALLAGTALRSGGQAQTTPPRPQPQPGAPWSLLDFPELLANAWLQEDVEVGPVAEHKARGVRGFAAGQDQANLRPVKRDPSGGIEFAADTGMHLRFPVEEDALKLYRWSLIIFRTDARSGTGETTTLLNVNQGRGAGERVPWVRLQRGPDSSSLSVVYGVRTSNGPGSLEVDHPGFASDGATWHVHLQYRRNGRVYSRLDGGADVTDEAAESLLFPRPESEAGSIIGNDVMDNAGWAYDAIILGQSELTEAIADKLQAWALWRVGRQSALPEGHRYRQTQPVVDREDFPHRYRYDPVAWSRWTVAAKSDERFVNRGKPVPPEKDMVTVFRDDFRVDSATASDGGFSDLYNWFGPGWNTSVGVDAFLLRPTQVPDVYTHDPVAQTLTLSLQVSKWWRGAALYTVDDSGRGRSWTKGVFELRAKFPKYDKVPGGFFPAFWSYAIEPLFWRTSERIEVDFFEAHGQNDQWMNGGSVHSHKGVIPGYDGRLTEDAPFVKIWGGDMTKARLGRDFHYWDGEFHTYTFRIEDDLTYFSIDGIELFRVPTSKELMERKYLIMNFALRKKDGEPDPSKRHDMIVDYVEVRQPADHVAAFAPPFTARPTLEGDARVGSRIRVVTHLEGVRDVQYLWHRDGYPIPGRHGPVYAITPDDAGASLRCLVRAVGALNQPEAWTEASAAVAAA